MNNDFRAQLTSQTGLGRPGGAASRGSSPKVNQGVGSGFAAMENALLKTKKPDPKKLAKGGGKQFKTQAGGQ